jgi:hypothetical protein
MAVNMSTMVYLTCQQVYGRPVTFTSKSGNSFTGTGRGIYTTGPLDIVLEDGSVMSDQTTILDIRAAEFSTLPVQGDTLNIPYEPITGLPALGDYEVLDVDDNGGGEITLQLRKLLP